ncbi:MAG: hypothetical protein HYR63_22375 [Proteobacteria bacterium]|nr:hypothetical protein [Pseudomonadota bacterium]MBI3497595.1 hypothetical protein [Pseudomonadota bacterium]
MVTVEEFLKVALQHHRAGRLTAADYIYRQVLAVNQDQPDALHLSGVLALEQGEPVLAAERIERAIAASGDRAHYHLSLAKAKRMIGQNAASAASTRRALALDPAQFDIVNLLGAHAHESLDPQGAMRFFTRALAVDPSSGDAESNLAMMLQGHVGTEPAVRRYKAVLQREPTHSVAAAGLAFTFQESGRSVEAEAEARRLLALGAPAASVLPFLAMTPLFPRDREEIAAVRNQLLTALDRLIETAPAGSLPHPEKVIRATGFFLAYHDWDDRATQERLARLYLKITPDLDWTAPHCEAKRPRRDRLRIGFVSFNLRSHTIGVLNRGILANLSRQRFETFIFRNPRRNDSVADEIEASVDGVGVLPFDLAGARRLIAGYELDALIYPDIGMDAFVYFLAFARLAPAQVTSWGHPDTTGIPNIDYFLSAADIEPEGAEAHYSERLIRLRSFPNHFTPPDRARRLTGRAAFGLPEDAILYGCAQNPVKFHPDFDAALVRILREDRKARLVLNSGGRAHWLGMFLERLKSRLPSVQERVVLTQNLDRASFTGLLEAVDALVDPFHFSGGNTSLEAFSVAQPVVTWPGRFMRGRLTHGCYRRMGMADLVADGPEAFVGLAQRLANDRPWRQTMSETIRSRSPVLYDNVESVRELERFLEAAIAAAERGERLADWSG